MLELVIGGARSGKSAYAQRHAAASGLPVCVIVTALPGDDEMARRIARHREHRPADWRVVEAPLELSAALAAECGPGRFVIVDCMTMWLCNHLDVDVEFDGNVDDETLPHRYCAERDRLLDALVAQRSAGGGQTLLVSNEVGMGVVPLGRLSRVFVDESGWLNQELATRCDRVTLVSAGLPLMLKDPLKDPRQ